MEFKYAGFGVRFVAALIDGILLALANTAIGYVTSAVMGDSGANINMVLSFAMSVGYYVWYQQKSMQTLGKKAMKIKVVTMDGKTPTLFAFFLREIIGKMVSVIILFIGYLMVLWDPKKQALHDRIAGTYVIYVGDSSAQVSQPTPVPSPTQNIASGTPPPPVV